MPATTPILGIPYPLPADAVTDYPATGQSLANLLETLGLGGLRKFWDSTEAGVVLPAVSVSTPTLPQTAKHLLVVWTARGDVVATIANLGARVNGSTAAAYYAQTVQGSGAVAPVSAQDWAVASGMRLGALAGSQAGANLTGVGFAIFPGYSESPTVAARMRMVGVSGTFYGSAAGATSLVQAVHGFYASAPPLTSLTFLSATGGNLVAPSRFTVYGVG